MKEKRNRKSLLSGGGLFMLLILTAVLAGAIMAAPLMAVLGGDDLLAGIPEPADAVFQAEDSIQEDGRHFFYISTAAPNVVVRAYGTALESVGWTIEYSGGGGDPFGIFGGGAGLTATNDDGRYLSFNAGGPAGKTYIDACVWPAKPDDDNCGQNQDQTSGGNPTLGANADLLEAVPEPAKAVFKSENAIQEGGRHYFYFSDQNTPAEVISDYQAALEAAGWTIEDSGSGGDPFGLFGSGANVTATSDGRYLKVHAGGPPGSTFVDACIWPAQPDDDNCDQDQQNQDSAAPGVMGTGGDLLAGIPEPANADFQSENAMPEGGRHFFYTSSGQPANIVSRFQAALEAAGWTIEDSGGGGDPFGFASGAGLTATEGGRYLKFNAGGPAGSTYIDACVWPAEPGDDDCDQNNRQTTGTAVLGSAGALLAGVPELAGAEFKSEDAIQEGGRHYFFFSSETTPADIVSGYETALSDAGWRILSSGGDPFGLFGAGLTASDGTRYLALNAGGPQGSAFVDACIWPAQPSDTNCGQNNQTGGSARLGAGGSLLANVPEPADAAFQAQDSIQEGGRHFYYTSTNAPADVVDNYQTALEGLGWTIVDSGGGGDPFGFGSGAGLTATNGSRYLKMNAGGPSGSTHVDVCVWPLQPNDNNCGQNNNQNRAGNAVLGSSSGLMTGVPELQDAEFKAEDAIHEGGRHFFFTSSDTPANVVSGYEVLLTDGGWEILSSGGGGDPFGFFGGGAGLTATDGTRVLKLNAGGPTGQTFVDACVWPSAPENDYCGQNNNN